MRPEDSLDKIIHFCTFQEFVIPDQKSKQSRYDTHFNNLQEKLIVLQIAKIIISCSSEFELFGGALTCRGRFNGLKERNDVVQSLDSLAEVKKFTPLQAICLRLSGWLD